MLRFWFEGLPFRKPRRLLPDLAGRFLRSDPAADAVPVPTGGIGTRLSKPS
jgi:hypothetical protein